MVDFVANENNRYLISQLQTLEGYFDPKSNWKGKSTYTGLNSAIKGIEEYDGTFGLSNGRIPKLPGVGKVIDRCIIRLLEGNSVQDVYGRLTGYSINPRPVLSRRIAP